MSTLRTGQVSQDVMACPMVNCHRRFEGTTIFETSVNHLLLDMAYNIPEDLNIHDTAVRTQNSHRAPLLGGGGRRRD
jgi:hypothetical protein